MQDELSAVRSKADFDIAGSLPKQNIDTGMGLERVAFLLQGKQNMYEIDVMFPVIEKAEELTGRTYGARPRQDDVRFRVVADHVRSSMMLIGDGVTPGNEGRGYVLRRLLRRAVRSMRLLGYEDRALPELLPVSRDKMAETYTELHRTGTGSPRSRSPRRTRSGRPCAPARRSSTPRPPRCSRRAAPCSPATRRSPCTTPTASRST